MSSMQTLGGGGREGGMHMGNAHPLARICMRGGGGAQGGGPFRGAEFVEII